MKEIDPGRPVSLYLHFPFCVRKCRYCDFLSGPASEEERDNYIDLLCREIRLRSSEVPGQVDTVFLGGGTPSLMTAAQMRRLMECLSDTFAILPGAEISMEVNPGTADGEKLRSFRESGINRISIGVQSFDDEELRLLGRIHTAGEAREIFRAARAAGFANINLDLMSALPGQKMETWEHTLREAVRRTGRCITLPGSFWLKTGIAATRSPTMPRKGTRAGTTADIGPDTTIWDSGSARLLF